MARAQKAFMTPGPEGRAWCCVPASWARVHTRVTHDLFVPQGVHDVRLAYIQFALSFLIAGDDSTIVQVLELKGRCASASEQSPFVVIWGSLPQSISSALKKSLQPLPLPCTQE